MSTDWSCRMETFHIRWKMTCTLSWFELRSYVIEKSFWDGLEVHQIDVDPERTSSIFSRKIDSDKENYPQYLNLWDDCFSFVPLRENSFPVTSWGWYFFSLFLHSRTESSPPSSWNLWQMWIVHTGRISIFLQSLPQIKSIRPTCFISHRGEECTEGRDGYRVSQKEKEKDNISKAWTGMQSVPSKEKKKNAGTEDIHFYDLHKKKWLFSTSDCPSLLWMGTRLHVFPNQH